MPSSFAVTTATSAFIPCVPSAHFTAPASSRRTLSSRLPIRLPVPAPRARPPSRLRAPSPPPPPRAASDANAPPPSAAPASSSGGGEGGGASPPPQRPKKPEQTFFGIRLRTNGDVIKFGFVAIGVTFAIKAILQSTGVPDLKAGQMTTGFVSVFALLGWVSSYVLRVGTKNMTYAQQLRDYEDKVIQKRYEELSEDELAALTEELDEDM